ncbi:MAG: hypothetical protein HQ464_15820 [Planctomycetes bacterium]|nr:hypothetical protein [Planctomycetota bacterium]
MWQTTPDGANPSASALLGLLVVTVDRLPAWMLAAYGSTWVATPAIDRLAARGIVFDRMITPTLNPHDSIRGMLRTAGRDGLALQEAAAAAGWRMAVITDDPAVAADVACGPDDTLRLVEAVSGREVAADDGQTAIARVIDAALEVLAAGTHRLVWCHVGSLGVTWDAPDRHRDRYVDPEDPPPPPGSRVPGFAVDADTDPDRVMAARQVFAGQVTLLDSQLGRLFDAVQAPAAVARQPAAGWTVLLAGGRGLPLGLHGWVGVGGQEAPYGERIHVPAILADAAGRMAAQRYGGLVVPADLGCTLADLVAGGVGSPAGTSRPAEPALDSGPVVPWRGVSLVGLLETWSSMPRDRVVVTSPHGMAIVTPAWHCLLVRDQATHASGGGGVQLFTKPDDFFELADVANRCPGVAEPLSALLAASSPDDPRPMWVAPLPTGTLE